MDKTTPRRPRLQLVAEVASPIYRTPTHRFESWVLIWYSRGQGRITFAEQELALRPGLAVCIPPRMPYAETADDGFISLWIVADALPFPVHAPSCFDLAEDRRFAHAARLLLEEFRRRAGGWQEACDLALAGVLRCLRQLRGEGGGGPATQALVEVMRQHAFDPEFTVAGAMARVGGSPVLLRRRFREDLGMPPLRFLTDLRIEHARKLLRLSDLSISEVALRSGYADQFYFSRLFRQRVGSSPRGYRHSLARS